MADKPRGRLIAVEAARGVDAERGAAKLRDALRGKRRRIRAGVSRWDASGTFYELGMGGRKVRGLSPRTLLLLYASDLAFRLRWEIEPALAGGQVVIAAGYVETAIAFGEAAGVPPKWTAELFRFAPRPDVCLHAKSDKDSPGWKRRPMDGFPEFAAAALDGGKAPRPGLPRCEQASAALRRLKRAGRCGEVRKKAVGPLVKSLRARRPPKPSKAG